MLSGSSKRSQRIVIDPTDLKVENDKFKIIVGSRFLRNKSFDGNFDIIGEMNSNRYLMFSAFIEDIYDYQGETILFSKHVNDHDLKVLAMKKIPLFCEGCNHSLSDHVDSWIKGIPEIGFCRQIVYFDECICEAKYSPVVCTCFSICKCRTFRDELRNDILKTN